MFLLVNVCISACSYFIHTDLDSGNNKIIGYISINSVCASVCLFSCLPHSVVLPFSLTRCSLAANSKDLVLGLQLFSSRFCLNQLLLHLEQTGFQGLPLRPAVTATRYPRRTMGGVSYFPHSRAPESN